LLVPSEVEGCLPFFCICFFRRGTTSLCPSLSTRGEGLQGEVKRGYQIPLSNVELIGMLMTRLIISTLTILALFTPSPSAGPSKQNFALSFQGGGLGNLDERFFKSLTPLFGGGLEYYPLNPISVGVQFQFSTKGNFGSPVSLGIGSIGASGSRTSTRLFQTTFFTRPTASVGSALKFFAIAGVSVTKITRTSNMQVVPAGSTGSVDQANKIGGKFGAGAFIHLKSNIHLNFTAAFDTQPQKLFSTQTGLTFFFNPFSQKADEP